MEILNWIENWYAAQCDGYWEHHYGITISNIDNPGWDLVIDISGTELEGLEIPYSLVKKTEEDWYGLKVENNKFEAFGDPSKLAFLLEKFKELVEGKFKSPLD